MDSILNTIKKMLGIDPSYTAFDTDVIVDINSVLMILTQIGVGPSSGFFIKDSTELWSDFLGESTQLEAVKSYIYLRVKVMFDTTASPTILDAMTRTANELEWRLNVQAEELASTTTVPT